MLVYGPVARDEGSDNQEVQEMLADGVRAGRRVVGRPAGVVGRDAVVGLKTWLPGIDPVVGPRHQPTTLSMCI